MLKVRVATALVLGAVVAAVVLLLPLPWVAAFFLIVALLAAYEWARLAGVAGRVGFVAYGAALSAAAALLWLFPEVWPFALFGAGLFWLAALALVLGYPRSGALLRSKPLALAAGAVAICGAWLGLVALKANPGADGDLVGVGAWQVFWLLVGVTLADAGAYFAGRRFGRRKLKPSLSPGKTVEGAAGGALGVLAWALGGAALFDGAVAAWLLFGLAVFAAATTGDLFESALKRASGAKDSGSILPGHGGVLDRIDSVLAAAPVFALLVLS